MDILTSRKLVQAFADIERLKEICKRLADEMHELKEREIIPPPEKRGPGRPRKAQDGN